MSLPGTGVREGVDQRLEGFGGVGGRGDVGDAGAV